MPEQVVYFVLIAQETIDYGSLWVVCVKEDNHCQVANAFDELYSHVDILLG